MKLRHLDIFYAVMTCGSLTRAAEVLHISQPAASKALKHAEHTRGCNPTSSKFIHTWLRFGEIMRGSLSALPPIPIIYYADNNLV